MIDFNIKNLIYEFNVRVPKKIPLASEIIKNILVSSGISVTNIIENDFQKNHSVSVYKETRKDAQLIAQSFQGWQLKGIKIQIKKLPKKFWLERWKKDWHPFRLTKKIDVVPVWERARYKIGSRKFILLDTITAFGTGLHETTKFTSQLIEDLEGEFNNFLDIGTGSGILSAVARHSGAKNVCAIDISLPSTQTAKENFRVNGLKFDMLKAVDLKKFRCSQKFDLVAANLITHDLMTMKRKIFSLVKKGKWLALSGISLSNLNKLKADYNKLPLKCIKVVKGKKWAALLYKKAV